MVTSLDGFVSGPNGEFDWPVLGPELAAYSEDLDTRVDTLLFGRPVWEWMVAFWPTAEQVADDDHTKKFAPFWRATPKIVFSRSFEGDDWSSRVLGKTDLADEVRALKDEDGGHMLLTGGTALATALTEHGLVDEYHIAVHPVVLGGGRRLFGGAQSRVNLRPTSSRLLDGRVAVTAYARA